MSPPTVLVVVMLLVVAACGGAGDVAGESGGEPAVTTSGPTELGGRQGLPSPTDTPTGKPAPLVTVTGTVVVGVESGCLLLAGGGVEYVLIGGPRDVIRAGAVVAVTGRPNPSLLTTCQQGTPLPRGPSSPRLTATRRAVSR